MSRDFISNATKRGILEAIANGLSTTEIVRRFHLKSRSNVYRIKNVAKYIPTNIKSNWSALLDLSKVNSERRIRIIKGASDKLLGAIRQCCKDLIEGTVPLSESQRAILYTYKSDLRRIVRSNKEPRSIRRYLVRKENDFIPAVIGPVLDFYS